jgi:hypothetical protein
MGRPKGSKNKTKDSAPLTRRETPKVSVPKPLPLRGKEEPETTVGAEPVNVATKSVGKMGKCKSCNVFDVHSETDHLCYNCHKDAQGLEFDGKTWVKKTQRRK